MTDAKMEPHSPHRRHPAVRHAMAAWSVLLAVLTAIAGIVVSMHPEWGLFGDIGLAALAVVFLSVLGWWAWGMGGHFRTIRVEHAKWIYLATAEVAALFAIAFGAVFLFLPRPQVPPGLHYYVNPDNADGILFLGDDKSFAKKAELRLHFYGNGHYEGTYQDNIYHKNVIFANFYLTTVDRKTGMSTGQTEGMTYIYFIMKQPMNFATDDVTVNFNGPDFPGYTVGDITTNTVQVAIGGPLKAGDLDIYVDGTKPQKPIKVPF